MRYNDPQHGIFATSGDIVQNSAPRIVNVPHICITFIC